MTITRSKRTEFIGAHLTPEAKKALKAQARKKKKSSSAIVAEAVEEKLEREPVVEDTPVVADGK
jgi:predicted transcriptional regulator